MNRLLIIGDILFVVFLAVFLLTTNIRLVVNAPKLYSYGFDKYDIERTTGIERLELIDAGRQIREYFNNNVDRLDVRIFVNGIKRSIYGGRETTHMVDVKNLVRKVYQLQYMALVYIVFFFTTGVILLRIRGFSKIVNLTFLTGLFTIIAFVALSLLMFFGFDRLFIAFHLISFSNDLWQLDPSRHMLIAMFPQNFFFDATLIVAGLTIIESVILIVLRPLLRRLRIYNFRLQSS
mgnify:CR=1 FL=1|tara:strand:+ start:33854 stop:34558 length:705 start_codon:yes stop_codon:yes gene_type:complete